MDKIIFGASSNLASPFLHLGHFCLRYQYFLSYTVEPLLSKHQLSSSSIRWSKQEQSYEAKNKRYALQIT